MSLNKKGKLTTEEKNRIVRLCEKKRTSAEQEELIKLLKKEGEVAK